MIPSCYPVRRGVGKGNAAGVRGECLFRRGAAGDEAAVPADIDAKVDMTRLEETLMSEGLSKFAEPHHKLIALIGSKRK